MKKYGKPKVRKKTKSLDIVNYFDHTVYFCCCICRKMRVCEEQAVCANFSGYDPIFMMAGNCFKCSSRDLIRSMKQTNCYLGACKEHAQEFEKIMEVT